jgi:VanZ family protein
VSCEILNHAGEPSENRHIYFTHQALHKRLNVKSHAMVLTMRAFSYSERALMCNVNHLTENQNRMALVTNKLHQMRKLAKTLWIVDMVLVVVGSLIPGSVLDHLQGLPQWNDKLVHFMNYAFLALLPPVAMEAAGLGIAFAAAMVPLGIAIEFFQKLVPGRSFELGDMAANCLGVMAGLLSALIIRNYIQRHDLGREHI